jgi:trk system potassium uptake protein TrkA
MCDGAGKNTGDDALVKVGAKEVDIAIVTISAIHAKILAKVGAHRIVFPEWDMGHKVAENFVYPWYSKFTKIDGGDFYFGKIKPTPEMIGKTMAELKFSQRYMVIVILLEHEGKQESPSPIRPFLETDGLWVLGHRSDMDELVTKGNLEGI